MKNLDHSVPCEALGSLWGFLDMIKKKTIYSHPCKERQPKPPPFLTTVLSLTLLNNHFNTFIYFLAMQHKHLAADIYVPRAKEKIILTSIKSIKIYLR